MTVPCIKLVYNVYFIIYAICSVESFLDPIKVQVVVVVAFMKKTPSSLHPVFEVCRKRYAESASIKFVIIDPQIDPADKEDNADQHNANVPTYRVFTMYYLQQKQMMHSK